MTYALLIQKCNIYTRLNLDNFRLGRSASYACYVFILKVASLSLTRVVQIVTHIFQFIRHELPYI